MTLCMYVLLHGVEGGISERGSVLYFRMATENFEITIVVYHPDNGLRSYKPQTKHAGGMILPGSSQIYS